MCVYVASRVTGTMGSSVAMCGCKYPAREGEGTRNIRKKNENYSFCAVLPLQICSLQLLTIFRIVNLAAAQPEKMTDFSTPNT